MKVFDLLSEYEKKHDNTNDVKALFLNNAMSYLEDALENAKGRKIIVKYPEGALDGAYYEYEQ